jgi:glycosyltransferase involved in cell wall biosynthesis
LYSQIDVKVQIFDVNASENFSSKKSYNNLIDSLIETVKQYHFDVVYTNTIETFYGVRLADKLNLPSVWGIHESVDYLHYFSGFDVSVQKEAISMFSMSTKVVYVADASAELYKNLNTYNFKTVKNGIDISNIERYMKTNSKESVRKRLGISNQKKVISIFGAVCLRKGQKIFVEAAKKIIENGYEETKFFIVGAKPSTYLDELKIYISNNNLNENIEIIPVCDDIFQYYRASDIFVCASYEESSPQVILEAMSFRLPIVSTNVFGIPELVRNNQEALLCNPGDAQAISRNIQNIIDDERLTEKLVQNAYYRVKTKFTFELMIKSYNKLLISAYNEGENNVYKLLMKRGHK